MPEGYVQPYHSEYRQWLHEQAVKATPDSEHIPYSKELDDISREFKNLSTHKVNLHGVYCDDYHVEINPLPENKHEFTLILIHGIDSWAIKLF